MTKYTVIEPFKDGTGRHRPGDVLDGVDHADALINAGIVRPEPEAESQEPKEQQEEKTENKPQPAVPEKKAPSKKTGGKNK